jgi:hypothetical protein
LRSISQPAYLPPIIGQIGSRLANLIWSRI